MRRLDVLGIGLALLLGGGILYGLLLWAGLDTGAAQQISSVVLLLACLGWTFGYLKRVLRGEMTLKAQWASFETQQIQERLRSLSPEELQALQAELESEKEGIPDWVEQEKH
ncbi:DUF3007 family protein [Synechococcus sp. R6-6]|jgi:hypothetical protein|uniref:DUF3007 family protein n=2 Tax=unclassified Synechococcus TaxID=2626047 RepID=UPI0039C3186E